LLPDPTSEDDETRPVNLVEDLNSVATRIKIGEFINRLDKGTFVTIKELADDIPSFTIVPTIIDR